MSHRYDLVVRRGTIVDGTGGQPFAGDVAIRDGRIAAVGKVEGEGIEEIDASGKLVTPGFVDVHTHYDGQVTWEDRILASSQHGVTTVVMGNCGVGFAPCRPGDREALIAMMEGVEDIPEVVMAQGLPWNWETFPEYLDAVEARPRDIDIAAQFPHSALRVYVMGDRAIRREPATPEDCARMAELTGEAIDAGAIGFATSRLFFHRDRDGELIPSIGAEANELAAIARVLRDKGTGVVEAVINFGDNFDEDFAMLEVLARESGRPLSYSLAQLIDDPDHWKRCLDRTREAVAGGLQMKAQVIGRPTGMLLGLDVSFNPFTFYPAYKEIADLPLAEKVAAMREPEMRRRILSEEPEASSLPILRHMANFDWMFAMGDPPNYEPPLDTSISAIARRTGNTPQEIAYDMLLENDGHALIFQPIANYAEGNLDAPLAMMRDENAILGLGDGGAHYGMIMDSSYPTFMLTYWARDRKGTRMTLSEVVKALALDTAEAVGLADRGRIALGYKGDLNIIDFDKLRLHAPRPQRDLPSGGRRLMQRAEGIEATIVSGVTINRSGEPTGALPGKLIRGAQAAPAAA